jgi:hypothetical protein
MGGQKARWANDSAGKPLLCGNGSQGILSSQYKQETGKAMFRWMETLLDSLLAAFWSVFFLATFAGIWREARKQAAESLLLDDDDPVFLLEGE